MQQVKILIIIENFHLYNKNVTKYTISNLIQQSTKSKLTENSQSTTLPSSNICI